MQKSRAQFISFITAGLLCGSIAHAANSVDFEIHPATSTTGGISADILGMNALYQYSIQDGQSITDQIPVEICMTAFDDGEWQSLDIALGSASGNLPGITSTPSTLTFNKYEGVGTCKSAVIEINSGALNLTDPNVAQNFNATINLSGSNPIPATGREKPQVNASTLNISQFRLRVAVIPAISSVSCFITDSSGYFLADCDGNQVSDSASEDGRFSIIANKKRNIEVATNPGQFYYNLIWRNDSDNTKSVNVDFERTGVLPHGRQAIHAAVFNGYLSTLTPTEFNLANQEGIPEGQDDNVSLVEVPAGSTLLVTYHLEWAGLGEPVPAICSENCETADQYMNVTAIISGSDTPSTACSSGAFGFKK